MKIFKGFRFPKEMTAKLQRRAAKDGKTQTRIVFEALTAYLATK